METTTGQKVGRRGGHDRTGMHTGIFDRLVQFSGAADGDLYKESNEEED